MKKRNDELNEEIVMLISKHSIFNPTELWNIFQRVKSFDKLFCIMNMSQKFHIDLGSAEYYITNWIGGQSK